MVYACKEGYSPPGSAAYQIAMDAPEVKGSLASMIHFFIALGQNLASQSQYSMIKMVHGYSSKTKHGMLRK